MKVTRFSGVALACSLVFATPVVANDPAAAKKTHAGCSHHKAGDGDTKHGGTRNADGKSRIEPCRHDKDAAGHHRSDSDTGTRSPGSAAPAVKR
jgi:hypothetical protein